MGGEGGGGGAGGGGGEGGGGGGGSGHALEALTYSKKLRNYKQMWSRR